MSQSDSSHWTEALDRRIQIFLPDTVDMSPAYASAEVSDTAKIKWRRETHELLLNGQVIRKVRVMRFNNIPRILDAFAAAGWPRGIPDPLSAGQQTVHQALSSLNQGLKQIKFHSQCGGTFIYWQRQRPVKS